MPEQDETVALPPSSSHQSRSRPALVTRSNSRFEPGQVLAGRYRIIALLGKGGMGEVYRADDLMLEQQVALKFLPPGAPGDRFRTEVKIARQVSHPNVCRVYDAGEIDGQLYLSMEYVDGEDLGSLLRRIGRLPNDKALEISRKLCAGLSAAHEKGVLHRDLKPGNVMLDGRGQVLLTDFGLAAVAGEVEGGEIRSGTPAYMAPEQLSGKEVTVRSDLYSLGLVMYELFTGKRPHESDTLAGLIEARSSSAAPLSITTLVKDVDPLVERVIQKCLESNPASRPSSAIAVAAMLPGGDPLAAALAAGETPSPQMVAAAGEGRGLASRFAIPLLAIVIAGVIGNAVLANRRGVMELARVEYGPEVLKVRARDIVNKLGYTAAPVDDEHGFEWNGGLLDWIKDHEKPTDWKQALASRPSILNYWYRQSAYPLTAGEFHDDLLTPGIVTPGDPAPTQSGTINVKLDGQGRLMFFEAIPPQKEEPKTAAPPADWNALFAAAGLDPASFADAAPMWTFIAASDERRAWTGLWPGTKRQLRVEAASFRGKPVGLLVASDWTNPDRMPAESKNGSVHLAEILSIVAIVIGGGALLARRNWVLGKGDRKGAMRLAVFTFVVNLLVWAAKVHLVLSPGIAAMFLLAIITAIGWAAVTWMIYIALEPFVRRYWPQSIISWSSLMVGNWRDPVVGRDVLAGIGLGMSWRLIDRASDYWGAPTTPGMLQDYVLMGLRTTIGGVFKHVQWGIRSALVFFFLLFVLRVLLRKQWLAGAGFVIMFALMAAVGDPNFWSALAANGLVYAVIAMAVVRLGLLSLAMAFFAANMGEATGGLQPNAWYFSNVLLVLAIVTGMAVWGCWMAMGRKEWRSELFG